MTDTCTELTWQKASADTNGEGEVTFDDRLTWCQAVEYCDNLSFAGHTD